MADSLTYVLRFDRGSVTKGTSVDSVLLSARGYSAAQSLNDFQDAEDSEEGDLAFPVISGVGFSPIQAALTDLSDQAQNGYVEFASRLRTYPLGANPPPRNPAARISFGVGGQGLTDYSLAAMVCSRSRMPISGQDPTGRTLAILTRPDLLVAVYLRR